MTFYNKGNLDNKTMPRPLYWCLVDVETGELIKRYNCKEKDFSSASFDDLIDIDISTCGLIYFNCTVTPKYDIRLSYQQTLFIDKTLLTMSDEEFNNLTVGDFSRSKYKPITFEGLI